MSNTSWPARLRCGTSHAGKSSADQALKPGLVADDQDRPFPGDEAFSSENADFTGNAFARGAQKVCDLLLGQAAIYLDAFFCHAALAGPLQHEAGEALGDAMEKAE